MTSYTAWHVGRTGEIAGGMTQVMNAYTTWAFRDFEVKVITSRDGTRGLRAMRLYLGAAGRIVRLARDSRSVVVVHLSQRGSFLREGSLLLLAHMLHIATVAHLHGSDFVAFAERRPSLVRRVLGAADRIIVLSAETESHISGIGLGPRTALVANAVSYGNPGPKEKLIVFGGKVCHRKGVDVLLDAWNSLDREDWRLALAGPIDMAIDATVAEHAELLGAVPHADLMVLLDKSQIAVLPSRDEAMPLFILEALARRNCVIATDVGGIAPLLQSGAGLVVDPGDVEQLAEALTQAMTDQELRLGAAEKGFARFAENYSENVVSGKVESVWASALNSSAYSGSALSESKGPPR